MPRLAALVLLICALALGACGDSSESSAPAAPSEAVTEVESGASALLDVRTPAEFRERHAEDAEHIPLADLQQGDRPDVAKDARIYVYCRTGRRAAEAVELLRREGWRDVVNVGGLDDWERMGGAVETG